jgi:hypothetical protein
MRPIAFLSLFALGGLVGPAHGGQLIAVDSNRSLYEIDAATGAKTLIGTVSSFVGTAAGLARDPASGTIYLTSATTDTLYTLDVGTGIPTVVGGYGTTSVVMHGLEWDSAQNTLWGGSGGNLYHINPANGFASLVGLSGLSAFFNLGYEPGANVLYGTNNGTDSFYQVDRNTGVLTLVGPLGPGPTNPSALAYDSDNSVLYMLDANTDSLYTVDPATGAAALVGPHGPSELLGLVYIPGNPPHTPYCFGDGTGTGCPCGNAGVPGNGCASSVNPAGANLTTVGSASITTDTLRLRGSGMPNSSALYFQGTTQSSGGAGAVFGDGLRCASGVIARLGTKSNVGGASQYPVAGDPPVHVRGMCLPGDFRTYQVWYRNAAAFCTISTFNLSNGAAITWAP